MTEGFDANEISEGLLAESTANSNVGKSFDNPKSPNDSSPQSDAALPPSKKSPAGELGPEALLNNSTVASPNQEIRSPASADAAKTSKAQPSKDPISQSLASSEKTATQSGLSQEHQCFVDIESGITGRALKFEFSPKDW